MAFREKSEEDDESFEDLSKWKEREQEEYKLRNWLKEPPGAFFNNNCHVKIVSIIDLYYMD